MSKLLSAKPKPQENISIKIGERLLAKIKIEVQYYRLKAKADYSLKVQC